MIVKIKADNQDVFESAGMSYHNLNALLASSDVDNAEIKLNKCFMIRLGNLTFRLPFVPSQKGNIKLDEKCDWFIMDSKDILTMLKKTKYFHSKEDDRFYLASVKFDSSTICCTDARKLCLITHGESSMPSFILPYKVVNILIALLDKCESFKFAIVESGKQVIFKLDDNIVIKSLLINYDYPSIDNFYKLDYDTKITDIDGNQLREVCKGLQAISDDIHFGECKVTFLENQLKLILVNKTAGEAEGVIDGTIPAELINQTFALNINYLNLVSKNLEGETVTLSYKDDASAVLFDPSCENRRYSYRYIIMPIRKTDKEDDESESGDKDSQKAKLKKEIKNVLDESGVDFAEDTSIEIESGGTKIKTTAKKIKKLAEELQPIKMIADVEHHLDDDLEEDEGYL
jgi:DNA polymerase III sliding clamp (beta) subunit (PCNA family)